ncbi:DinB family protein [Tautonia sociabilis]|uniref:DinB family protein n=1 Tax=Tautonia sociabilis TaxID=2080755 RepID=A0A432ML93_9BACT|nr:DinB family protein [Tautonia sociabilis]RUL87977.1 DinB family protein [Tautonia sociabilis]
MSRLELLVDQIGSARRYSLSLLDDIAEGDWFRMPSGGITHVAWQVGHLAFAEYRLALERIRGVRPDDPHLISDGFLTQFGRGSVPDPDPATYPRPGAIRAVLDRVHRRALEELN